MDIVEGVIVHTLGKIDRIQYFHFISMPYQHLSALNDDRSLGVRDHIGGMTLEQDGLEKEP